MPHFQPFFFYLSGTFVTYDLLYHPLLFPCTHFHPHSVYKPSSITIIIPNYILNSFPFTFCHTYLTVLLPSLNPPLPIFPLCTQLSCLINVNSHVPHWCLMVSLVHSPYFLRRLTSFSPPNSNTPFLYPLLQWKIKPIGIDFPSFSFPKSLTILASTSLCSLSSCFLIELTLF